MSKCSTSVLTRSAKRKAQPSEAKSSIKNLISKDQQKLYPDIRENCQTQHANFGRFRQSTLQERSQKTIQKSQRLDPQEFLEKQSAFNDSHREQVQTKRSRPGRRTAKKQPKQSKSSRKIRFEASQAQKIFTFSQKGNTKKASEYPKNIPYYITVETKKYLKGKRIFRNAYASLNKKLKEKKNNWVFNRKIFAQFFKNYKLDQEDWKQVQQRVLQRMLQKIPTFQLSLKLRLENQLLDEKDMNMIQQQIESLHRKVYTIMIESHFTFLKRLLDQKDSSKRSDVQVENHHMNSAAVVKFRQLDKQYEDLISWMNTKMGLNQPLKNRAKPLSSTSLLKEQNSPEDNQALDSSESESGQAFEPNNVNHDQTLKRTIQFPKDPFQGEKLEMTQNSPVREQDSYIINNDGYIISYPFKQNTRQRSLSEDYSFILNQDELIQRGEIDNMSPQNGLGLLQVINLNQISHFGIQLGNNRQQGLYDCLSI